MLQVIQDGLLLDRLLDFPLCVNAERVRFEQHALSIGLDLRLHVSLARLSDEVCEAGGVVLRSVEDLRGRLRIALRRTGIMESTKALVDGGRRVGRETKHAPAAAGT